MDRTVFRGLDRTSFVDRLADNVHDTAERARADRRHDRLAGVHDGLTAGQAFGGVHGDRADHVLTQVLGDFENQGEGLARLLVDVLGFQRVQDRRQGAGELDVDDGADDLGDLARACDGGDGGCLLGSGRLLGCGFLRGGGVGHRACPYRNVWQVGIRALRRRR
ncbi:hypothetical protein D3C71_1601750 [compost metagenome]